MQAVSLPPEPPGKTLIHDLDTKTYNSFIEGAFFFSLKRGCFSCEINQVGQWKKTARTEALTREYKSLIHTDHSGRGKNGLLNHVKIISYLPESTIKLVLCLIKKDRFYTLMT